MSEYYSAQYAYMVSVQMLLALYANCIVFSGFRQADISQNGRRDIDGIR